jgi:hypothetical protein
VLVRPDEVNRDGGFPFVRNHLRRNGSIQASHLSLLCISALVLGGFKVGDGF